MDKKLTWLWMIYLLMLNSNFNKDNLIMLPLVQFFLLQLTLVRDLVLQLLTRRSGRFAEMFLGLSTAFFFLFFSFLLFEHWVCNSIYFCLNSWGWKWCSREKGPSSEYDLRSPFWEKGLPARRKKFPSAFLYLRLKNHLFSFLKHHSTQSLSGT